MCQSSQFPADFNLLAIKTGTCAPSTCRQEASLKRYVSWAYHHANNHSCKAMKLGQCLQCAVVVRPEGNPLAQARAWFSSTRSLKETPRANLCVSDLHKAADHRYRCVGRVAAGAGSGSTGSGSTGSGCSSEAADICHQVGAVLCTCQTCHGSGICIPMGVELDCFIIEPRKVRVSSN